MTCTCHDILLHHVWRLQDSVVPGPQECDSVVYEGLVQHHTCILEVVVVMVIGRSIFVFE